MQSSCDMAYQSPRRNGTNMISKRTHPVDRFIVIIETGWVTFWTLPCLIGLAGTITWRGSCLISHSCGLLNTSETMDGSMDVGEFKFGGVKGKSCSIVVVDRGPQPAAERAQFTHPQKPEVWSSHALLPQRHDDHRPASAQRTCRPKDLRGQMETRLYKPPAVLSGPSKKI
jgi:hypothetical protein